MGVWRQAHCCLVSGQGQIGGYGGVILSLRARYFPGSSECSEYETRPRTNNDTRERGCGSFCRTCRSMSYCQVGRVKPEFSLEFRKRCLRRRPGYMRTDIFDSGFRARLESIHPFLPCVRLSGARVDLASSLSNTGRRVRPVSFIASESIDLR